MWFIVDPSGKTVYSRLTVSEKVLESSCRSRIKSGMTDPASRIPLNLLDSGFRRNDGKAEESSFYEFMKVVIFT